MASPHLILPTPLPSLPSSPLPLHLFSTSHLPHLPQPNRPNLSTHATKKNPWLDPFDDGPVPDMEYGSLFTDGKQEEDPRPPDNPDNPYGFLKFPQGYNVELTGLASKVRGDVRRCCCVISGGVYENLLFFPAIQLIKDRYPGVQVDIVASPRGKQTYEINKNVRWATAFDPDDSFPEPAEYIDMLSVLKNRYYDLMVSTKLAGFAHAAFMFMTSTRDKVSYVYPDDDAAGSGFLLTETLKPPTSNLSEGGYNMYDQMLDWLGRPTRNFPREPISPLKVSISKKLREYVVGKYKNAGVEKGKYVVIHGIQSDSKASMQSRGDLDSLLPVHLWAEITKEMRDIKPLFVIPHEKEREELEETIGGDSNIIFITTPGQLAALINDSVGVISTNTAAVQLANAREKRRNFQNLKHSSRMSQIGLTAVPTVPVAPAPSQEGIKLLVENYVQEALAKARGATSISMGKPYPEEYDLVPYPKGFVPRTYTLFNGTGNPHQHLAHFHASCCNTGGNDALLFRQFGNSLDGVAFEWYMNIPDRSVRFFVDLESMFLKRFAGAKHHVTIGDLMMVKQKQGESISEYILRWRNLSVRCTPPLLEQHAVELLLMNIKGPIAFLLEGFTVRSFKKLLRKVSSLQAEISKVSALQKDQVSAINKGKKPIQVQPEQLKKKKERSDQASSSATNTLPFTPSFEMRRNKRYPFKREVVRKIFKELLKYPSFKLPEPKYPEKIGDKKKPNYCLYHRQLGHTIENCFTFKDWLEQGYKQGIISIPREYLDSDSGSVDLTAGIEEAPVAGFED